MQLQEILKERGLSKFKLAIGANITPNDLYLALNGKKPLYPGWKKRIAEFLQMDESELFCERDNEAQP